MMMQSYDPPAAAFDKEAKPSDRFTVVFFTMYKEAGLAGLSKVQTAV